MGTRPHFPASLLDTLATNASLRIRAGRAPHRFLGIWSVVVGGRVFVRSWNDKPTGWYRAWRADSAGAILVGRREVPVRAVPVRGARLQAAISAAYQAKYWRPASLVWARGMDAPERRATTLELVPVPQSKLLGSKAPGRAGSQRSRARPGRAVATSGSARRRRRAP